MLPIKLARRTFLTRVKQTQKLPQILASAQGRNFAIPSSQFEQSLMQKKSEQAEESLEAVQKSSQTSLYERILSDDGASFESLNAKVEDFFGSQNLSSEAFDEVLFQYLYVYMRSGIDNEGNEDPKTQQAFLQQVKHAEDIKRLAMKRLKGLSFQVEYFVVYLQYALLVLQDKSHVENLCDFMLNEGYPHLQFADKIYAASSILQIPNQEKNSKKVYEKIIAEFLLKPQDDLVREISFSSLQILLLQMHSQGYHRLDLWKKAEHLLAGYLHGMEQTRKLTRNPETALDFQSLVMLLKLMNDKSFNDENSWRVISNEIQHLVESQKLTLKEMSYFSECFYCKGFTNFELFNAVAKSLETTQVQELVKEKAEDVIAVFRGLLMHKREKALQNENFLLPFVQFFFVKLEDLDLNLSLSLLEAVRNFDDAHLKSLEEKTYARALALFQEGSFNKGSERQAISRGRGMGFDPSE